MEVFKSRHSDAINLHSASLSRGQLATVPVPAICEDEKLPTVLIQVPSAGWSPIISDVNCCDSRLNLSQVAHFAFVMRR